MHVEQLAGDLAAEQAALDHVVAVLDPGQWQLATASPGWTVADQIGHLAYFDRTAVTAIEEPERFVELRDALFGAAFAEPGALDELTLGRSRGMSPSELLEEWRQGRELLATATRGLSDSDRVVWYGPDMSARSFLTARLMETWAHGTDVVDAVGASRPATDRLVHVAQLGVITRGWSYANRGIEAPPEEIGVELVAPSGAHHNWGPAEAAQTISGGLEDFCLVVTQRRHVDDTDLVAVGPAARDWLVRAQAFAGPATEGPAPLAVEPGVADPN